MPEPTQRQKDAARINGIDIPDNPRWHSDVLVLRYDENLLALISEHGSITYCPDSMLDAHLAGIR